MAGSSHYNAICNMKIIFGDKVNSAEQEQAIGPGTQFPFVTSVTVMKKQAYTSQITLEIEAPFAEGREMLNGPMFYTGNILEITMRYPDDDRAVLTARSTIFKGGIGLTLTPNGISGTITCEGKAQTARYIRPIVAANTEPTFDWLRRVVIESDYSALLATDRVIKSINETGYVCNDKRAIFDMFEDFCVINDLTWVENPDTFEITILDDEEVDKKKVGRVFVMRNSFIDTGYLSNYGFLEGATLPNPRVYPIVSFSPELSAGFFTNKEAVKVIRTGIRRDGQREVEEKDETTASAKRTTKSTDGAVGSDDIKAGSRRTAAKFSEGAAAEITSLAHPENDDREGDNERHKRSVNRRLMAYNANLTTFGIPELEPTERVAVVGLGDLLDGIFVVQDVTQTWSAGKIETSMSIYGRNAGLG